MKSIDLKIKVYLFLMHSAYSFVKPTWSGIMNTSSFMELLSPPKLYPYAPHIRGIHFKSWASWVQSWKLWKWGMTESSRKSWNSDTIRYKEMETLKQKNLRIRWISLDCTKSCVMASTMPGEKNVTGPGLRYCNRAISEHQIYCTDNSQNVGAIQMGCSGWIDK